MFNKKKFPMRGSFDSGTSGSSGSSGNSGNSGKSGSSSTPLSIDLTLCLDGGPVRPTLRGDIVKYWSTLYDPRGDHVDLAPTVVGPMQSALKLTVVATGAGEGAGAMAMMTVVVTRGLTGRVTGEVSEEVSGGITQRSGFCPRRGAARGPPRPPRGRICFGTS